MQIYNPTNLQMTIPVGGQYVSVPACGTSGNILGTPELITLLMTAYSEKEIALIVSGPQELTMVANIPNAVNYVVQTVDEAVQKFQSKE